MSHLAEWKDIFELLSYVTIVLGFPAAIYQYQRSKLREQADREYGTYNALDEKYLQFQGMCFEHPQLDIFDIPDANPQPLSEQQRKQELIAFTMLISVFERSYLMYHDQSNKVKAAQWTGWDEYIRAYCDRENFRNAWEVSGETFDRNFEGYVETILQRSRISAARPRLPDAETLMETRLHRVSTVTDPDYLSALRLVSQYGWAGGTFNTNELSFLIETSNSNRISMAFVLLRERQPVGVAVLSYLAHDSFVVVHEMVVSQSVDRDPLFAHFWSLLLATIQKDFPAVTSFVAEVPLNQPRHLKTEVFARGLSSAGFIPAEWPYYLPRGFNNRSAPASARLHIRSPFVERSNFLAFVHDLYFSMYSPLWRGVSGATEQFEEELTELEARVSSDES